MAEYMSEVLTNPAAGYYVRRDHVFGARGDFTTSPEISQMFGEMIGIWCMAMWAQMGRPSAARLVELGPGRGTLMADLVRGTSSFHEFSNAMSICLVEISPSLRRTQWETLGCVGTWSEQTTEGQTPSGMRISWHRSLEEVDAGACAGPALYVAHEFLDALPVHQFERGRDRAWCERLVDEAGPESPHHVRLVLSPGATPAVRAVLPLRTDGLPQHLRASMTAIEVSPQSMAVAEGLAQRVGMLGGAALIIDYGRDGPYRDSLVGIRDHGLVGVFDMPGTADLSARVDFDALRLAVGRAGAGAVMHGPISQAQLLLGLGMEVRLQRLLEEATPEEGEALIAGYERLVGGAESREDSMGDEGGTRREKKARNGGSVAKDRICEGMGLSYKAVCICPEGLEPVAFSMSSATEQPDIVDV